MTTRLCTKCGEQKPLTEFYSTGWCKPCRKDYAAGRRTVGATRQTSKGGGLSMGAERAALRSAKCADCGKPAYSRKGVFQRPSKAGEVGIWQPQCPACHIKTGGCITPSLCKASAPMPEEYKARLRALRMNPGSPDEKFLVREA